MSGGTAVYKLFADGHEELVRADIEPISLRAFKDILAAGDTATVTNGSFVPFGGSMLLGRSDEGNSFKVTSYIVPSLLFEEVSLKEPVDSAPQPPTLPSPLAGLR